jgi:predicted amidohydrolase YtcJ
MVSAEAERGSISVGKRADIVVLDRDIFTVPPRDILAAEVLYTVSDGDVVFARDDKRR